MKRTRKPRDERREQILAVALTLAERIGYTRVTRDEIAQRVGISGAAVQYCFGSVPQLRRELMAYAVEKRSFAVIAQGISSGDTIALQVPDELRAEAFAVLAGPL